MASLLLQQAGGVPAGASRPGDVAGVVEWFGAMQAQDLASVMWSLGIRLPGSSQSDVHDALERREALRTWPMRGTVHLVPAQDARWMLELMGARPLSAAGARRASLGLSEHTADRAVDVLAGALAGGGRMTRAQCIAVLEDAGIRGSGNFAYHLLWYASQRGVTCFAANVGREQSFALLDDWAPEQRRLGRDEALATMAVRYFRSHGPTTRQDFAGWTGLTAADAKAAIAAAGDALTTVEVEGVPMLLEPARLDAQPVDAHPLDSGQAGPHPREAGHLLVLPGFDEYLLGYKDRDLMIAPEHKQAIIPGRNGVFQSSIVCDGRVVGTWKRSSGRTRTVVKAVTLLGLNTAEREQVEAAFEQYARYLGTEVDVHWT